MKVLIIGGVAAGTKAAAKIKREQRDAQVKIITAGKDISYAGCGLPYYVGGVIGERDELIVNTPEKYQGLTGAQVVCSSTVTAVFPDKKQVAVKGADGSEYNESYDKLIIATGAYPFLPDIPGKDLPGVFCVRTPDDAENIKEYIKNNGCKNALVCGAGFIGLEIAENLKSAGLSVTIIDVADSIMPGALDPEMSLYAKRKLTEEGTRIITGCAIKEIKGDGKVSGAYTDAGNLACDIVILALGVRPATEFLQGSGIETVKGTVVVDEYMKTNIDDIYAVGDCAMVHSAQTGKGKWSAMGSTANIAARALAKTICGKDTAYGGCLGTGIARLSPSLSVARTGMGEAEAKEQGIDFETVICVLDDKAHYYPGADTFIIKLISDKSGKLLGSQVLGGGAVDKINDIAVTAISAGMKISDFDTVDFSYAPPFSTAIHPFVSACYILENKLAGELETITPKEYLDGAAKDYTVIDALPVPTIPGARHIDLSKVNGPIADIPTDEKLLLVCAKGKRGYFLQNRLKAYGYTDTRVLEGGMTFNRVRVERKGKKLPAEEIKRVKGLGCLQDKRYDDVFNVRVITRNGKLTSEEQMKVAEAASKFGSGEVTMTTRLTLEIQGVAYDSLDECFEFLAQAGLETGGTGSKVRPVVSCKGTTCQYGLIDTFALSEKLHDIYYKGWHDVVLPHKFKIAVGGCPNNCTKPDLNDLGIVGQRAPQIDLSKCRGCKVCQVESACPIRVSKLVDGKIVIDPDKCNHCGRCVGKCPFGAVDSMGSGYRVYIGGRWGKKVAQGMPLKKIFTTEQEIIDVVEKAVLIFRDEGKTGERFADTVARLGFDYVEDKILNGKIDRDEILEKKVKGGATC